MTKELLKHKPTVQKLMDMARRFRQADAFDNYDKRYQALQDAIYEALAQQEQPSPVLDGKTPTEFLGGCLYDFQQATGCDTAEQFLAAKAQQEQPANQSLADFKKALECLNVDDLRGITTSLFIQTKLHEKYQPNLIGAMYEKLRSEEQPAQEPVAWLHGTTFQVVVSKNRPNSLAAWLPLFAHPAPTQPALPLKPTAGKVKYEQDTRHINLRASSQRGCRRPVSRVRNGDTWHVYRHGAAST